MPGTLQVGGNTVITHTGDAGAGTNTINDAVVFPSGHLIKTSTIVHVKSQNGHITANNPSAYQDLGIAGSFTTLMSSSDSFLELELYSSMSYMEHAVTVSRTYFMLTSSNATSFSTDNSMHPTYPHYYKPAVAGIYQPIYWKTTYRAGVQTPTNLTSYSAGQTLYFRIWCNANTTNPFHLVHDESEYCVKAKEFKI